MPQLRYNTNTVVSIKVLYILFYFVTSTVGFSEKNVEIKTLAATLSESVIL